MHACMCDVCMWWVYRVCGMCDAMRLIRSSICLGRKVILCHRARPIHSASVCASFITNDTQMTISLMKHKKKKKCNQNI